MGGVVTCTLGKKGGRRGVGETESMGDDGDVTA